MFVHCGILAKCLRPRVSAGRFEFTAFLPGNTQGVIVRPLGKQGVMIAATDTQRGFGKLDQVSLAETKTNSG